MSPFSSSPPPSADKSSRLSFQEYMQLVELPAPSQPYGSQHGAQQPKRYMSQRASWMPGIDLPSPMREQMTFKGAAYGGHVYSQSGLAASKAFAEMREELEKQGKGKQFKGKVFGIHLPLLEVFTRYLPIILTNPTDYTRVLLRSRPHRPALHLRSNARLHGEPGLRQLLRHGAPAPAAHQQPLGRPLSPVGRHQLAHGPHLFHRARVLPSHQLVAGRDAGGPPQSRFAHILDSRPPHKWEPAPLVDIDRVVAMLPPGKKRGSGSFPCVDMKKVDMRDFNRGKPLHERRELILYRRILSPAEKEKKKQTEKKGQKEKEDPDAHILTHAFEADRNGLLMCGNHVGFGSSLARAATLSYSFVVHHDDDDEYTIDHKGIHRSTHKHDEREEEEEEEEDEGGDEWWIQEATFPRVEANRCVVLSKIWSPQGKHVATEYQDGIIQSTEGPDPRNSHRMSKL
ncbi:acyl-CoA thioesterase II [Apiospora hydei]|uniref:Acyl-CoA thioesterase II n=1 Tax=Apiospora hydei TaxID=1337664 RepID=A0ABR1UTU5_9PEZI